MPDCCFVGPPTHKSHRCHLLQHPRRETALLVTHKSQLGEQGECAWSRQAGVREGPWPQLPALAAWVCMQRALQGAVPSVRAQLAEYGGEGGGGSSGAGAPQPGVGRCCRGIHRLQNLGCFSYIFKPHDSKTYVWLPHFADVRETENLRSHSDLTKKQKWVSNRGRKGILAPVQGLS